MQVHRPQGWMWRMDATELLLLLVYRLTHSPVKAETTGSTPVRGTVGEITKFARNLLARFPSVADHYVAVGQWLAPVPVKHSPLAIEVRVLSASQVVFTFKS